MSSIECGFKLRQVIRVVLVEIEAKKIHQSNKELIAGECEFCMSERSRCALPGTNNSMTAKPEVGSM